MCGICPGGCGVYAHLVNGQLDRITFLENHPWGIANIYVKSLQGRMPFRAKVTDWVLPGSVEVNVGSGGPLQSES